MLLPTTEIYLEGISMLVKNVIILIYSFQFHPGLCTVIISSLDPTARLHFNQVCTATVIQPTENSFSWLLHANRISQPAPCLQAAHISLFIYENVCRKCHTRLRYHRNTPTKALCAQVKQSIAVFGKIQKFES